MTEAEIREHYMTHFDLHGLKVGMVDNMYINWGKSLIEAQEKVKTSNIVDINKSVICYHCKDLGAKCRCNIKTYKMP